MMRISKGKRACTSGSAIDICGVTHDEGQPKVVLGTASQYRGSIRWLYDKLDIHLVDVPVYLPQTAQPHVLQMVRFMETTRDPPELILTGFELPLASFLRTQKYEKNRVTVSNGRHAPARSPRKPAQ